MCVSGTWVRGMRSNLICWMVGLLVRLVRRFRMLRFDIWRRVVIGGMRDSMEGRRVILVFMSFSSFFSWFRIAGRRWEARGV